MWAVNWTGMETGSITYLNIVEIFSVFCHDAPVFPIRNVCNTVLPTVPWSIPLTPVLDEGSLNWNWLFVAEGWL